ncbi:MAG: hypothetical protein AB1762_06860 [Gemmatimonadota bacterium]
MRTFIAAIGGADNTALSSFVRERLASDATMNAAHVVMDDLGTDALEVAERLNAEWPRFERVIFLGSVPRARPVGSLAAYRWDGDPLNGAFNGRDADGWVRFDSTLLAVKDLVDLPDDVIVVEVEPDDFDGNTAETTFPALALERAQTLLRRLATSARAADALPKRTLGGL